MRERTIVAVAGQTLLMVRVGYSAFATTVRKDTTKRSIGWNTVVLKMTDDGYKSMRVREEAWEKADKARGENETWSEYLLRCAEEPKLEMTEDDVRTIIDRRIESKVVENARL